MKPPQPATAASRRSARLLKKKNSPAAGTAKTPVVSDILRAFADEELTPLPDDDPPFHPNFPAKLGNSPILESSDGKLFNFPFELLVQRSSFFSGLADLKTPDGCAQTDSTDRAAGGSPADQPIIPLFHASTGGLALILHAIALATEQEAKEIAEGEEEEASETDTESGNSEDGDGSEDGTSKSAAHADIIRNLSDTPSISDINDAFTIAHIYDITTIGSMLKAWLLLFADHFRGETWLPFILACLPHDPRTAAETLNLARSQGCFGSAAKAKQWIKANVSYHEDQTWSSFVFAYITRQNDLAHYFAPFLLDHDVSLAHPDDVALLERLEPGTIGMVRHNHRWWLKRNLSFKDELALRPSKLRNANEFGWRCTGTLTLTECNAHRTWRGDWMHMRKVISRRFAVWLVARYLFHKDDDDDNDGDDEDESAFQGHVRTLVKRHVSCTTCARKLSQIFIDVCSELWPDVLAHNRAFTEVFCTAAYWRRNMDLGSKEA